MVCKRNASSLGTGGRLDTKSKHGQRNQHRCKIAQQFRFVVVYVVVIAGFEDPSWASLSTQEQRKFSRLALLRLLLQQLDKEDLSTHIEL